MAVPDFQTLMRPLLEELAPGDERPISSVREALAQRFELTEEELAERLPSRLAKSFNNRVGWAATYLYRCGLLERPRNFGARSCNSASMQDLTPDLPRSRRSATTAEVGS